MACAGDWPHISAVGLSEVQTAGLEEWPKRRQRSSSSSCTQRRPAGLGAAVGPAALKRAAEKKAALASQGLAPKNTENLGPAQQRQVEAAEVRRRELQAAEDAARPRE